MALDSKRAGSPNPRSTFWRILYGVAGIALLAAGRHLMTETDDAILPWSLMVAGVILLTIGVRSWPRRPRL